MTRRLASVDALRGCTVALMLLVNDAGDWAHTYGPLKHAFASWIAPLAGPYVASLAYALAFVALWWVIVCAMDRNKVYLTL